jgi:hypothetical protein
LQLAHQIEALTLLPTPRTSDTNGAGEHGDGGPDLRTALQMLPTPTVPNGSRMPKGGEMSLTGQTPDGKKRQVDINFVLGRGRNRGLKLQPGFALYMMGYPTDYLDLEAGEMPPSKR